MNDQKQKFEFRGVPIAVKDNGEFAAVIGGKELTAPSLAAIKKKLERTKPFEPFDGFLMYHGGDMKQTRVIGVKKHRNYNSYHWITQGGYTPSVVYMSTKENLAIAKQITKLHDERDAAEKKYNERIQDLEKKLVAVPLPGEESES